MTCQKSALNPDDFSCIQLVYGNAGEQTAGEKKVTQKE